MMVATQDQGGGQPATRRWSVSPARVIGGTALMFLGVALMSYGAHFLAKTGTCSGTGYVSYGPVRKCGPDEALYIMSACFVGPVAAIAGWLLARAWGWLWPTVCIGVGVGLITIANETTATAGARTFGLAGGDCLFALAVLSVIVSLRKRHRLGTVREAAGTGTAVPASTPAPSRLAPAGVRVETADRSDPLDRIAKLARLRDTGALTEDEYEIQKTKLLAET
jgi:Short C-terminal domain